MLCKILICSQKDDTNIHSNYTFLQRNKYNGNESVRLEGRFRTWLREKFILYQGYKMAQLRLRC